MSNLIENGHKVTFSDVVQKRKWFNDLFKKKWKLNFWFVPNTFRLLEFGKSITYSLIQFHIFDSFYIFQILTLGATTKRRLWTLFLKHIWDYWRSQESLTAIMRKKSIIAFLVSTGRKSSMQCTTWWKQEKICYCEQCLHRYEGCTQLT